jgi:uncharacterized protein (TIGR00297 family)
MMWRVALGVVAAALIALAAHRARLLSTSGAIASSIVGSLAVAAGWNWGVVLVVYFVAAAVLSHFGRRAKSIRTDAIVAKPGPRDASQVLANGATFAVAAVGALIWPSPLWGALAAGSLAASEADTAATEIGTLFGGEPQSILTYQRVPIGTSGGVTALGTLAAVAGASFVSVIAVALDMVDARTTPWWAIVVCGFAGAMVDSLLGATLQARRWCDACNLGTERRIHRCGNTTRGAGGIRWLDNDAVNLVSSAAGGLLAAILAR